MRDRTSRQVKDFAYDEIDDYFSSDLHMDVSRYQTAHNILNWKDFRPSSDFWHKATKYNVDGNLEAAGALHPQGSANPFVQQSVKTWYAERNPIVDEQQEVKDLEKEEELTQSPATPTRPPSPPPLVLQPQLPANPLQEVTKENVKVKPPFSAATLESATRMVCQRVSQSKATNQKLQKQVEELRVQQRTLAQTRDLQLAEVQEHADQVERESKALIQMHELQNAHDNLQCRLSKADEVHVNFQQQATTRQADDEAKIKTMQKDRDRLKLEVNCLKEHQKTLQKERQHMVDESQRSAERLKELRSEVEEAQMLKTKLEKHKEAVSTELARKNKCVEHLKIQQQDSECQRTMLLHQQAELEKQLRKAEEDKKEAVAQAEKTKVELELKMHDHADETARQEKEVNTKLKLAANALEAEKEAAARVQRQMQNQLKEAQEAAEKMRARHTDLEAKLEKVTQERRNLHLAIEQTAQELQKQKDKQSEDQAALAKEFKRVADEAAAKARQDAERKLREECLVAEKRLQDQQKASEDMLAKYREEISCIKATQEKEREEAEVELASLRRQLAASPTLQTPPQKMKTSLHSSRLPG